MNILNYFGLKVTHKEKKVPKLSAEKAQKVLRGSKLVKDIKEMRADWESGGKDPTYDFENADKYICGYAVVSQLELLPDFMMDTTGLIKLHQDPHNYTGLVGHWKGKPVYTSSNIAHNEIIGINSPKEPVEYGTVFGPIIGSGVGFESNPHCGSIHSAMPTIERGPFPKKVTIDTLPDRKEEWIPSATESALKKNVIRFMLLLMGIIIVAMGLSILAGGIQWQL